MHHVSISHTDQGLYRDAGDNVLGNTLHLVVSYHSVGNFLAVRDYYMVVMDSHLALFTYFKKLHDTWPQERENGIWIIHAELNQLSTR